MGEYIILSLAVSSTRGDGYNTISTCSFHFPILFADSRVSSGNLISSEVIAMWPAVSALRFSAMAVCLLSSSRPGTVKSSSGGGGRLDSPQTMAISSESDYPTMPKSLRMG
jgi:hypothetical protein